MLSTARLFSSRKTTNAHVFRASQFRNARLVFGTRVPLADWNSKQTTSKEKPTSGACRLSGVNQPEAVLFLELDEVISAFEFLSSKGLLEVLFSVKFCYFEASFHRKI